MTRHTYTMSQQLHERAEKTISGGVNSPARSFGSVGGNPLFAERALGCRLWDVDGNEYIDYIGSWGPLICGHAHPMVLEAVKQAAERGTSFGMSTEMEIRIAEKITALVPSVEMLRMVNSGTEATMSALRLARGYTGRNRCIKFSGCYHGHGDSFLIKAGSGALTHGIPGSAGVTPDTAADTLSAEFNDSESVRRLIDDYPDEIAAVIVEPVAGNMGTVPPAPGFLEELRLMTEEAGIVLIFDEVMTGFRVSPGGAQELFGVRPDLTCFGKIVGGGLPVGAYGGKRDIMEKLAPLGPVYQAGTLSGNPLAMAAGLATLELLGTPDTYANLESTSRRLAGGLLEAANRHSVPVTVNRVGSMFTVFFADRPVACYEDAASSDTALFSRYFRGMRDRGILLPCSQFEAVFVSTAHGDDDIDRTLSAADAVLADM